MAIVEPTFKLPKVASKARLARQAIDKFMLDIVATSDIRPDCCSGLSFLPVFST